MNHTLRVFTSLLLAWRVCDLDASDHCSGNNTIGKGFVYSRQDCAIATLGFLPIWEDGYVNVGVGTLKNAKVRDYDDQKEKPRITIDARLGLSAGVSLRSQNSRKK